MWVESWSAISAVLETHGCSRTRVIIHVRLHGHAPMSPSYPAVCNSALANMIMIDEQVTDRVVFISVALAKHINTHNSHAASRLLHALGLLNHCLANESAISGCHVC